MRSILRLLAVSALYASLALAQDTTEQDAHQRPIAGYIPRKSLCYIGIAAYGLSALIHWIHFFTVKPRQRFLLYLTIGMSTMAAGFGLRIIYIDDPFSIGKYSGSTLFILLSPCLYLATDYLILSHLVRCFAPQITERALLVRQSRIVKGFVWSDVTTFLLQSAGGGLTATKNRTTANLGNKIAMVGIILQAVSFALFTIVFVVFGWRVRKHFPKAWYPSTSAPSKFKIMSTAPIEDWRILFWVVCVTCVGILIRSVFRVVEFAGGYDGPVQTSEGYFYFLDALPLWISMTLYCVVWPARVLNRSVGDASMEMYAPQESQKRLV
ncbi:hypothetical protein MKEN_00275300 [Mycena kentingensis (nom. inval.)]|nr:hypothetical protein MKEN_00275300 [Mycena kentingensis (nom. inval.)]